MNTENSQNLDSKYIPTDHEDKIYKLWEESSSFIPKPYEEGEKTFSILMPPPNANGSLHTGHPLFITLQDLMIRYHRMKGDATAWFPGLDHAGFETQVVFEKILEKQGESRFNMSREEFYGRTLEFVKENSSTILNQFKKVGASADWNKLKFTLDPDIVKIVYETFIKLYEDGLAYRAKKPVNWCTKHQTTLSDLEVKDREQNDKLYYIKYGELIVATVRPETIFADVAVAVNPEDSRYSHLIGKDIEVDFGIEKREIPVIGDEAVKVDFGTGALKITPTHDANDFEIAMRHNLPTDKVAINEFGKLTDICGKFAGLKVDEARKEVAAMLEEKDLLVKTESYNHTIKACYKCERTIEPRVIDQWFIAVKKKGEKSGKILADSAIEAVSSGAINFVTDSFEKVFNHWMENIRDWNVSRQIAWGIRLPVWYCNCGDTLVKQPSNSKIFFLRHGEAEHNIADIGNGDINNPSHLTQKGAEQINKVKKEFIEKGIEFSEIYASQMIRTEESAEILDPNFKAKIDARLNDISYGELEGKQVGELHILTDYHEKSVEGSENIKDLEARLESFIRDLTEKHKSSENKNILIVTSEPIFWALRNILNSDLTVEESRAKIKNGDYLSFDLEDLTPCEKCNKIGLKHDTDVFDTWFSSGQLPFATPKTTGEDDFDRFYPTNVMETGWDILFFWVARMIMLSLYTTDKVPFKDIYLNGMVRDKNNQKMSKSKGNAINPLSVIEDYGADALRIALIFSTSAGRDISIGDEKIRGMRNFTNKIWNIARFILMNTADFSENLTAPQPITDADKKILQELEDTITGVTQKFEEFNFHEAAQDAYQFVWHSLADTYLEASKPQLNDENQEVAKNTKHILLYCLTNSLKLLHPIMPFVTETIWQNLPVNVKDSELLITAKWPTRE